MFDFFAESGDDDGSGAVDGGEGDVLGEGGGDFFRCGLDGEHGAGVGEVLHEVGAGGDEGGGVLGGEDAGEGGGGDFAGGVAGGVGEGDAEGVPEVGEGGLVGPEGGLGVLGLVEGVGVGVPHEVVEWLVEVGLEELGGLVEGVGVGGEVVGELLAHAGVLAALAGVEGGDAGWCGAGPGVGVGVVEGFDEVVAGAGGGGAVGVVGAVAGEGVCGVVEGFFGVVTQVPAES